MDDPSKGKGKGLAKGKSVQDLRNQQFLTFSRNDALNFSVWLQVWNVNLFMAILWSGYQKEHLDYSMILRLSQEDGTLPQGLLSVFSLACFVDEYFQACTLPTRPTCTADPLFGMRVERFANDLVLNLADSLSTRRWT